MFKAATGFPAAAVNFEDALRRPWTLEAVTPPADCMEANATQSPNPPSLSTTIVAKVTGLLLAETMTVVDTTKFNGRVAEDGAR